MSDLDLDAIEARHRKGRGALELWLPLAVVRALEDVPALIAEVRRLRELHTMNQDALDEIPMLIAEIRRLREVLGLHGILAREELAE